MLCMHHVLRELLSLISDINTTTVNTPMGAHGRLLAAAAEGSLQRVLGFLITQKALRCSLQSSSPFSFTLLVQAVFLLNTCSQQVAVVWGSLRQGVALGQWVGRQGDQGRGQPKGGEHGSELWVHCLGAVGEASVFWVKRAAAAPEHYL
ncbi:hypothetical protein P7K49_017271 [Saguinus oedipus]|uniref:Uncharacterized protein n=1 Tax=Saguinus oedipus TaxID=9490 RepID=A0ABQ9V295_SAGOE|nr:hypothetical protein P7K49_017271 [Saguinus oedipus]